MEILVVLLKNCKLKKMLKDLKPVNFNFCDYGFRAERPSEKITPNNEFKILNHDQSGNF
jgi:hypothetical protein